MYILATIKPLLLYWQNSVQNVINWKVPVRHGVSQNSVKSMLPIGHAKHKKSCWKQQPLLAACKPAALYFYLSLQCAYSFLWLLFLKEVELFLALEHHFLLWDFIGNHRHGSASSLTCTVPLCALLCIMRKDAEEQFLVCFSFFKPFDWN